MVIKGANQGLSVELRDMGGPHLASTLNASLETS